MPTFKLLCTWEMFKTIIVEAPDSKRAINKAHIESSLCDVDKDGCYLDDSFTVQELENITHAPKQPKR